MPRPQPSKRVARKLAALSLALLGFAPFARAQSNEVSASFGGVLSQTQNIQGPAGGNVQVSSGYAAGLSYDHGFSSGRWIVPHFEAQATVVPPRNVRSASAAVPQSYDSLYATGGLRLEFLPRALAHPWIAAGAGYTLYIQSEVLTNGQTYSVHFVGKPVGDFGGGLDFRVWHSKHHAWLLSLRAQVRDFVSGSPQLNAPLTSTVQHNIISSGGVVFAHRSVYEY
jgi:hypothetical protein